MILDVGTKVLVVHRRLFEKDRARYFVGAVDCCEAAIAKVTGQTWVQDQFNGRMTKKDQARTKVVALASPGLIIYALPAKVNIETLTLEFADKGQLWLHDPQNKFKMDLSEICHDG